MAPGTWVGSGLSLQGGWGRQEGARPAVPDRGQNHAAVGVGGPRGPHSPLGRGPGVVSITGRGLWASTGLAFQSRPIASSIPGMSPASGSLGFPICPTGIPALRGISVKASWVPSFPLTSPLSSSSSSSHESSSPSARMLSTRVPAVSQGQAPLTHKGNVPCLA